MWAKIKEFYEDNQLLVIGVLFLVVAFIFSWLLRTDHRAGDNVDTTISEIATDNKRAGTEIKSATTEITKAQSNISRAIERSERIEEIVTSNATTVSECEQIVSGCQDLNREAKSILADVELANKARASGETKRTESK